MPSKLNRGCSTDLRAIARGTRMPVALVVGGLAGMSIEEVQKAVSGGGVSQRGYMASDDPEAPCDESYLSAFPQGRWFER